MVVISQPLPDTHSADRCGGAGVGRCRAGPAARHASASPGQAGLAGGLGRLDAPDASVEPGGGHLRIGSSRRGSALARDSARNSLTHRARPPDMATTTPRITPPNSHGATDARVRTMPSIAYVSVRRSVSACAEIVWVPARAIMKI